jgi:hypothetical protein
MIGKLSQACDDEFPWLLAKKTAVRLSKAFSPSLLFFNLSRNSPKTRTCDGSTQLLHMFDGLVFDFVGTGHRGR